MEHSTKIIDKRPPPNLKKNRLSLGRVNFFNVVESLLPFPSVERLGSLFKAPTPGIDNNLLEKVYPWATSGCRIWLFLENGPASTPSGPPGGRCRTWPVVDHPRGMKASGNDAASKFACTDATCYCQKSSRDAPVQENPLALMQPQRPSGVGLGCLRTLPRQGPWGRIGASKFACTDVPPRGGML